MADGKEKSKESGDPGLTPRQRRFALEYLLDLNGKQAAIRAGYSPRTAEQQASRLLRNVKVAAFLKGKVRKLEKKGYLQVEVLERELHAMCTADLAEAYDQEGKLLAVHEMPRKLRRALHGIEEERLFDTDHDGRRFQAGVTTKLKLHDKVAAIALAFKRRGLLVDKAELKVPGNVSITFGVKPRSQQKVAPTEAP